MRLGRALLAILVSCQPVPQPRPPSPDGADAAPSPVDAGSEEVDQVDEVRRPKIDASTCHSPCSCACQKLAAFECQEGKPTPKGESCEQVCLDTGKVPGLSLPTFCVMNATSRAQVRACGVACK